MIERLKELFRPKIKTLVIVRRGSTQGNSLKNIGQFARDNRGAVVLVDDIDSVRCLTIGPCDRLIVPKTLDDDVLRQLANMPPGEILRLDTEDADKVQVVGNA